jgi:hypothetical protein
VAPDAGRRRPSAGRHRWMPPRRRLDAEKRRSYDTAVAVAPLASWMPATPSNVHTLTGMRLCGAAACGGVATARRWRRRRGDVKTDEKSSATNRAILSLVVLMKPLGLFSRALTLTQEKSCILPIGAVHKRRRGSGARHAAWRRQN